MPSIDKLVEAHFKIKNEIDRRTKALAEELKPLEEKLKQVDGMIMTAMDEMGVVNVKTEHGTPYFTHPETFKVVDKPSFVEWVINNEAYGVVPDTLSRKEAVRDFIDGGLPDCIEAATIRKLVVKKG